MYSRLDGSVLVRTLGALALLLTLVRCDFTGAAEPRSLVVEAFLETGRPLPALTLRQTRALERPADSTADAARGADVQLVLDGEAVAYRERPQRPGRYEPVGTGSPVPSGVPWRLRVQWNDETARAAGTTPRRIRLTEACISAPDEPVRAVQLDSLRRDSLDIPAEETYIYPIDVALRWSRSEGGPAADTTHWLRARLRPDTSQFASELVRRFLAPVEIRREDQFASTGSAERRWTGVYAVPVDTSTSPLPRHRLATTVVRGDSAFGDFARTRSDSELREPISNVEGGLGIATAVAIDSLVQQVTTSGEQCARPS